MSLIIITLSSSNAISLLYDHVDAHSAAERGGHGGRGQEEHRARAVLRAGGASGPCPWYGGRHPDQRQHHLGGQWGLLGTRPARLRAGPPLRADRRVVLQRLYHGVVGDQTAHGVVGGFLPEKRS